LKTFEQCPKKYFHLKIAKDITDTAGEEAAYGTQVHEAAEFFVRDGVPIPEKFSYMRPIMDLLMSKDGTKHTEIELSLRKDGSRFEVCDFNDRDAWYRGIADLLIEAAPTAWLVDYKTGKSARYADLRQLDLMAGAIFMKFPGVQTVKSALAFVVSGEFLRKTHKRENLTEYLSVFDETLDRLDAARESGVWNPKSSGLCGWCPVTTCAHWRPRRK
jgi:hypothetical protein